VQAHGSHHPSPYPRQPVTEHEAQHNAGWKTDRPICNRDSRCCDLLAAQLRS
jgi:hypothetical protein